jgi:chromosome segregation ATPase
MTVGYAAMYEGLADVVKEFGENAVAYLAEAEKEAAEFNELAKAYAEACVAAQLADYEAGNASAEVTALNTALSEATDPAGIAAQIATLEGEIETAKGAIEVIEGKIEAAKIAVDDSDALLAYWESQLASVQAYLDRCEALLAEAKAEFDAAVEAAGKAE